MPLLTKEEIEQTRIEVLKELQYKNGSKEDKKYSSFDNKDKLQTKQNAEKGKKEQKENLKEIKAKPTIKSANKKSQQKVAHRLVKHLEKRGSPLHHHHFLRSLNLLVLIIGIAIIFLSGLLYVIFTGAEGGT